MRPFLYYSPEFAIPSFAFMLMLASLLATLIAYKLAPRRGLSQVAIIDLGIIATISAVIGMRVFHILVEGPNYASPGYSNYYWEHPTHMWQIWRGGFVSYGGILGIAIGTITYLRWRKLDTLTYLDFMALFSFPIVDFLTRLGCLMAGCCYGKPSPHRHFEYLLYIVFQNRQGDAGYKFPGVPLWPTQIYSMTAAVLMFLICYWIDRRKKFKGQVILSYLMLYASFRTVIELFRGDADRGVYFHNTISTGQIMSFLFLTGCLVLYFVFRKRYPVVPKAAVPAP